jgi:hypothetical protein
MHICCKMGFCGYVIYEVQSCVSLGSTTCLSLDISLKIICIYQKILEID